MGAALMCLHARRTPRGVSANVARRALEDGGDGLGARWLSAAPPQPDIATSARRSNQRRASIARATP
jgi:hypothetical protein